jgi:hypothetical protein
MSTIKPEKDLPHHLFMNFRNNLERYIDPQAYISGLVLFSSASPRVRESA